MYNIMGVHDGFFYNTMSTENNNNIIHNII